MALKLEITAFAKSTAKKEDLFCCAVPIVRFNTWTPPILRRTSMNKNAVRMRRTPIFSLERTNRE